MVDTKKLSKLVKSGRLAPLYPHDVDTQQDALEVRLAQGRLCWLLCERGAIAIADWYQLVLASPRLRSPHAPATNAPAPQLA